MTLKQRRLRCESCGNRKDDVVLRLEPYTFEVEGRKVYSFTCTDCHNTAVDDI